MCRGPQRCCCGKRVLGSGQKKHTSGEVGRGRDRPVDHSRQEGSVWPGKKVRRRDMAETNLADLHREVSVRTTSVERLVRWVRGRLATYRQSVGRERLSRADKDPSIDDRMTGLISSIYSRSGTWLVLTERLVPLLPASRSIPSAPSLRPSTSPSSPHLLRPSGHRPGCRGRIPPSFAPAERPRTASRPTRPRTRSSLSRWP
jgi:hypothetical protein